MDSGASLAIAVFVLVLGSVMIGRAVRAGLDGAANTAQVLSGAISICLVLSMVLPEENGVAKDALLVAAIAFILLSLFGVRSGKRAE